MRGAPDRAGGGTPEGGGNLPAGPAPTAATRAWALASLCCYTAVVVALTMLKAFFVIGLLWRPEAQRERSLQLVPFAEFWRGRTWFGPVFDAVGNVAFFVPFGVLLAVVVAGRARPVRWVVAVSAAVSVTVEVCQYAFALGHSDVGDVILNTCGGALGAWIAHRCGSRLYRVWIALGLVTAVVFAGLVIAGPRLGDPDKVVDAGAVTSAH